MALGLGRSPAISAVKDDFTMSDMTHNFLFGDFLYRGDLSQRCSFADLSKGPVSFARLYCSGLRNARHACQFGVVVYQGGKGGADPATLLKTLEHVELVS